MQKVATGHMKRNIIVCMVSGSSQQICVIPLGKLTPKVCIRVVPTTDTCCDVSLTGYILRIQPHVRRTFGNYYVADVVRAWARLTLLMHLYLVAGKWNNFTAVSTFRSKLTTCNVHEWAIGEYSGCSYSQNKKTTENT